MRIERRSFLKASAAALATGTPAFAAGEMPINTLGKTGLEVSQLTLGGYHMRVGGVDEAIKIIHRAIDLGINHFDSARGYHRGDSDATYGKALQGGLRKKVLLMSKSNKRDAKTAMQELEDTLRDMKTDYLDLWQCHEVMTQVNAIFGPGGAAEAFAKAKQQGKVRHIGFTGHRDPEVHLRLLREGELWETIQMPINLVDPHYLSFLRNVLPEARKRGLGIIAMKSNAMGGIGRHKIATIEECIRFTLSQRPDTLVSGMETIAQLEQNVGIVKAFQALSEAEQQTILSRTGKGIVGTAVENYKKPVDGAMNVPIHHDGEADAEAIA
jgi:predicted aldo/keto reductase-like oxidoreductase